MALPAIHLEKDDGWFSWKLVFTLVITIFTALLVFQKLPDRRRRNAPRRTTTTRASTTRISIKFHVLIPCHVDSDRRALLFTRCLQSVAMQAWQDRFDVFISVSGSPQYRQQAVETTRLVETNFPSSKAVWHIFDTEKQRLPQMEHLRSLVRKSADKNSEARLMFLDNDDMFHPMRLTAFQEALAYLPIPPEAPLPLSCKLLLNETMRPNEGRLTDLASPDDYFLWQKNPNLSRKVQWVPTSSADDMDCTEYMDFMVPTSIMQKFFRLTPVGITSHKFCDLRLLAILERLNPCEVIDVPHYPWLLAHHKTSMDTKWRNFDNHGRGEALGAHSRDQASVGTNKPTAKDAALSTRFKKRLSPGQIALCRGHLESMVIQYIGWDDDSLADMKREKIGELNRLYGPGLADALWQEVVADMMSLFNGNEINMNRGAWQSMIDDY